MANRELSSLQLLLCQSPFTLPMSLDFPVRTLTAFLRTPLPPHLRLPFAVFRAAYSKREADSHNHE